MVCSFWHLEYYGSIIMLCSFWYQIQGEFDHFVTPGIHLIEGGRNLYLDHLTTNDAWKERRVQIGRRLEHFEASSFQMMYIVLYVCN
jgi:hypothetical protein